MAKDEPARGSGTRGSGTRRRAAVAQRRAEALELRRAGLTYRQIADRLGYRTKGAAVQDIRRALDQITSELARDLLALELSRLDGALTAIWGQVRRGDLGAIDRLVKIMDRRSRYLGLDHDNRDHDRTSDVDAWLDHMLRGDG